MLLSAVAVQYEITPLGRKLQEPFKALYRWTIDYLPEVEKARAGSKLRILSY